MTNALLFYIAALFNLILATAFIVVPEFMHSLMVTGQAPEQFALVYMFGILVGLFGYGYFLAARNFRSNRAIIKLGAIGKLLIFLTAAFSFASGAATVQMLGAASGDLLFAILFWRVLSDPKAE